MKDFDLSNLFENDGDTCDDKGEDVVEKEGNGRRLRWRLTN